jgi:hypothetical protein
MEMKALRRPRELLSALVAVALSLGACHGGLRTGKPATDGAVVADSGRDGSAGGSADGGSSSDGGVGGAGGLAYGGAGGSGGLAQGGSAGAASGGAISGGQSGTVTGAGGVGGSRTGGAGGNPMGGITVTPNGGAGGMPAGGGAGQLGGNVGGSAAGGIGGQGGGGPAGGAGGGAPPPLGGSGGFKIGGSGGTSLIGDRPSDWTPPFVLPMGPPGWRQGSSPLCDPNPREGYDAGFDAWADARGVFALVAGSCSNGYYPCVVNDAAVLFNAGSGWQPFYRFSADVTSYTTLLGGFQGGKLLVAGSFDNRSGAAFLDEGGLVFQAEISYPFGGFVADGNVVGGELAYAVGGNVLEYSAGTWSKVGEGNFVYSAWSDGKTTIAVGADQLILMGPVGGQLKPLKGVPAGDYEAVWGFAANDLWLGNSAGQLVHFDGSTWEAHQASARSSIQQLWGVDGTLYFSTAVEFGRWNGTSAEILLAPAAGTDVNRSKGKLGRFWGRSVNEVFIPVRDERYKSYICGTAFMLFFDGALFHWF